MDDMNDKNLALLSLVLNIEHKAQETAKLIKSYDSLIKNSKNAKAERIKADINNRVMQIKNRADVMQVL